MVARQLAAFLVSCSLFPAEEQMMQTTFAFSPQSLRMPRARSILSTPKSTVQLPTLSTTTIKITPIITSLNSQTGESGYIPPELSQELQPTKPPPFPKVGDLVRYYDLDGGNVQGQELVGKLSFIQSRKLSKEDESREWLGEVTELDNVGDGYYAEYPSRKRRKSKLLPLASLAPLVGSYVRNEDAFKIPTDGMGNVKPLFPAYNLVGYEGPVAIPVNQDVWESDMEKYGKLKGQLLKDALLAGLIGTAVAGLVAGLDTALVYFAGAIAGVGYLFFLSVKTDTLGSPDAKLGTNVSNVRFALPFLVLVGIAIMNLASGGVEVSLDNVFNSVSKEQFGAAMLGFLTYRLPLFVSQLAPIVGESAGIMLPGSAGIAMQMAKEAKEASSKGKRGSLLDEDLTTVFVVSGPVGTGKSELCKQLVEESEGKLITPTYLDKVADPIIFEQLEGRDELLQVDATGRYALTKDSIFKSVGKFKDEDGEEQDQVLVIDADVKLTKKLTSVGGIRLVGVWVGLDALEKFEMRLDEEIQSGKIPIPPDEDAESVRRGKIREIVKDIEYGVVSGIFEFTILNDDPVDSLKQLKSAAQYCFD